MGPIEPHEQGRLRHADQLQRSFKKGNSREEQKMTIKEDKRKLIPARRKKTKLRKVLPLTPNLLVKFVRQIMQLQSVGSVESPNAITTKSLAILRNFAGSRLTTKQISRGTRMLKKENYFLLVIHPSKKKTKFGTLIVAVVITSQEMKEDFLIWTLQLNSCAL